MFRFELDSDYLGTKTIVDPVGWDTHRPSIVRNETYKGMFRTFTADLTFVLDGYDYVKELWDAKHMDAECTLNIYQFNNTSKEWELMDSGNLDFASYKEVTSNGRGIQITVADDYFLNILKNRENISVNLTQSESIEGATITPASFVDLKILGQEVPHYGNITQTEKGYQLSGTDYYVIPEITIDGDLKDINDVDGHIGGTPSYSSDSFFTAEKDGHYVIQGTIIFDAYVKNDSGGDCTVYLQSEVNGSDTALASYSTPAGNDQYHYRQVFDINVEVDLIAGDRMMLYYTNGQYLADNNTGNIYAYHTTFAITLWEKYGDTYTKATTVKEAVRCVIDSITNGNLTLTNTIFDAGAAFEDYLLTNGFLIRRADLDKSQFNITFKELFESLNVMFDAGLEVNGNNIAIKTNKELYADNIIYTLPEDYVEHGSFSRELMTDLIVASIEVGYSKSEYNKVAGLEEFNNKAKYSTRNRIADKEMNLLSLISASGYAIEFARREPIGAEQKDTTWDNYNFIINAEDQGTYFQQLSDEEFTSVSGISNLTTPINLALTPARLLYRHGYEISPMLRQYDYTEKIKFNANEVDTDLSTLKSGENTGVTENDDLPEYYLGTAKLNGTMINFTAPLYGDIYQQLKSDPYGLIEVYSPIEKRYLQGWIKEVSMEANDNATNWSLFERNRMLYIPYDFLPKMGSNSASHFEVFADSETNPAYYAFDDDDNTYWSSDNSALPHYIVLTSLKSLLPYHHKFSAKSVEITCHDTATAPLSMTIQGSDDGSSYTDLVTLTAGTWTAGSTQTFDIANNNYYFYYRIVINTTQGGGDTVEIAEIAFMGVIQERDELS